MVLAALALAACTTQSGPQASGLHFTGDANPPGFFPGEVATVQGKEAAGLYPLIFVIATIVFVLVEGLLIIIAIRFRSRSRDRNLGLPAQTHGNNLLEFGWTIIPAITVAVLFIAGFKTLTDTDVLSANQKVTVDVTGVPVAVELQVPRLPRQDGPAAELHGPGQERSRDGSPAAPAGRDRAHPAARADVIHSFYVPQFFYKQDVVPGRVNEFELTPRTSARTAASAPSSAASRHDEMYFTVRVVSQSDFQAWVAAEQAKAPRHSSRRRQAAARAAAPPSTSRPSA